MVKNIDQKETRGGRYKNPRVFTEQGVAILATILKSSVATQVSINIMDAFVEMRNFINENRDIFSRINRLEYENFDNRNKLIDHDNKISQILEEMSLKEIKEKNLLWWRNIWCL